MPASTSDPDHIREARTHADEQAQARPDKAMTLRLSGDQHAALVEIASVNGTTIAHEIREAVACYIEQRRHDPEFQRRLTEYRAQQARVLARLSLDAR